jgi:hypothetical protein
MSFEHQARDMVAQAAAAEKTLAWLEKAGTPCALQEQRRIFMAVIAKLNSLTNRHGRGRDDLTADILEVALEIEGQGSVLSSDLLRSFANLRTQLRAAAKDLSRLDPRLSRNQKLAQALEDFETSWELAQRHLVEPAKRHALCGTVADFLELQRQVPAVKSMCELCDVELFLVLPRLLWLGFLAEPSRGPLLAPLLPEHFESGQFVSEPLQQLIAHHASLLQKLGSSSQLLLAYVIQRAVEDQSSSGDEIVFTGEAQELMDRFLLELEGWSMKLQRNQARDYNICISMLLQHLVN